MKRPKTFHIVVASNSQSMPFPWNKRDDTERPDLFTSYWMTYPHVMKRMLQERSRFLIDVSSLAVRGSTIRDAHHHAEHIMRWMAPDVTILNYGIVECWPRETGLMVNIEEFSEKLLHILEVHHASPNPPMLVLLGITRSSARKNRLLPGLRRNVADFNGVLKRSAAPERNIHFLDLEPLEQELGEKFLSPDAHHFSVDGHRCVAERLAELIEKHRPPPRNTLLKRVAQQLLSAPS